MLPHCLQPAAPGHPFPSPVRRGSRSLSGRGGVRVLGAGPGLRCEQQHKPQIQSSPRWQGKQAMRLATTASEGGPWAAGARITFYWTGRAPPPAWVATTPPPRSRVIWCAHATIVRPPKPWRERERRPLHCSQPFSPRIVESHEHTEAAHCSLLPVGARRVFVPKHTGAGNRPSRPLRCLSQPATRVEARRAPPANRMTRRRSLRRRVEGER
jgi:hypothetical protein